jgi:hypothetical protein
MSITDANGVAIDPIGGWRILANSTDRKTINLEAAPDAVRKISIEDTVGDAGTNNVTINANGSELIDGSASIVLDADNQRKVLKSTGTGWTVVVTAVAGVNTDDNLNLTSDTLEIRGAFSFPTVDGTSGQVLKTDGSGNLSWQDDEAGTGDLSVIEDLNTKTSATGEVTHSCANSNIFYHSSISADFTPDFTDLAMSNGKTTETRLILDQGATGYRPVALKVNGTGSTLHWEGTAAPTASANGVDMVEMRIMMQSDAYSTVAKYSKHETEIAAPAGPGVSVPANALLFLDASDASSYGGSGTTWTDLSGEGNHATLVNTPTWNNTDKLFEFSGTTSQHITVPSGFADFSNGTTFFVVADLGVGNNWERFLDFSVGGNTNDAFNFGRQSTGTLLSLQFYHVEEGNATKTLTSNQISNNTLASYAITTDGSQAKVYKNGSLVETITFAATLSNVTRTQNYIGRSRAGGNAYYEGEMAVIGIFNRDLSASEISDLHDAYETTYSL